jgi:(R,R)-butanediol dehydrogenase/meso-butanediol dehydrogenase/diacetyl reductase
MLAVRWHGNRDVRVDDVELDGPVGDGMIEAEVAFCGICGSDVAEFAMGPYAIRLRPHALSAQEPPVTLGHEFSARVTAVGSGVELPIGTRVAADACWRCGTCDACVQGDYNRCLLGGSIGLCSDGAMAPRVRFPAYAVVPLPDQVSDRQGALLEPLAVGLHAIDRSSARAGDHVVVLGFGAIGACTAMIARAVGLDVLVLEPNAARRQRAVDLGFAVHELTRDTRSDARAIRDRTGGGAHAVVDATGVAAALESALDLTRRGAVIVLVGLPKTPPSLDATKIVLFERSIVGSLGYVHDLPRVAQLIASGALVPDGLITRVVPLQQGPDELARLATAPGDDIKVLLDVASAR